MVTSGLYELGDLPTFLNVGLPAAPGLTEGAAGSIPGLILLDPLRHHVQDVMHHSGPEAGQNATPLAALLPSWPPPLVSA